MLRRLSLFGYLLLTACMPQGYGPAPNTADNCYFKPPTKTEAMAWRSAQRVNTSKSYRKFINSYPRSCYVPAATDKLGTVVTRKQPALVRNVPPADRMGGGTGGGRSY